MSPKELLYIEDALGHTQYLMTQCRTAASQLTDPVLRQQAQQPDVPADPPPEEPAKSIDPDDLVARAEEFFSGRKDPDKDSAAYDALSRDFAQAADQLPANLRALYVKLFDLGV